MSQEGFAEPGRRGVNEVSTTESPHPTLGASRLDTMDSKSGGEKACAKKSWSGRRGSNPRPTAWEAVTLPLSYSRLPDRTTILPQRQLSLHASLTSVGSQLSPDLRSTLVVPDSLRKYFIKSADQ